MDDPHGLSVEDIEEIESQRRDDDEELYAELVQKHGDTVNALINHRYVSLAVIAFFLGLISGNQTLIAMTAFLLTVVTAAWLWSRNTLLEIFYQRKFHHTHVFPGETTEVEIMVENRKWLPVTWLQIEDRWPTAFGPTKEDVLAENDGDPHSGLLVNAYSLRWYERVRRHYELKARHRGYYELGPTRILSGDPFSLFERLVISSEKRRYLVVYPQPLPLQDIGFPLHDPLGDHPVTRRLFEDPNRVIGVREYQPHDTIRDIHWKATARTGRLHAKVYEPTRGVNIVLAVNVASFEHYWRGFWPEMMEYTLSVAASIAQWTAEQDYTFGLICNGAFAKADQPIRVLPGRRPTQLRLVLEALAGVKYFVTAEFGRHILDESPRLPIGATMLIITPFISDMIAGASARLRNHGRNVVWVVLGKHRPDEIHNIPLHHLPISTEEPDWTEGEFAPGLDEEERERRLNARQRFLQERAALGETGNDS